MVFSRLGPERDYVICQEKVELRFSTSAAKEKVMQIRLSNSPECVLLGIRYIETAVRIRRWVYGFLLGQKADGKFTVRPKGRKGSSPLGQKEEKDFLHKEHIYPAAANTLLHPSCNMIQSRLRFHSIM